MEQSAFASFFYRASTFFEALFRGALCSYEMVLILILMGKELSLIQM
jgi:hypothetical protein